MNKKIIIGAVIGACAAALAGGTLFMLRKPTVKQLAVSNAALVEKLEDGKLTSASADVSVKLGVDLKELEGMYDDTSVTVEASGNGAIDGTDAHINMKAKAKALGEKESVDVEAYTTKDKIYLMEDDEWHVSDADESYTLQDLVTDAKEELKDADKDKDKDKDKEKDSEDKDTEEVMNEIQDKIDSGDYTLEKVDEQWVLTMNADLKDGVTEDIKELLESYGLDEDVVEGNFTAVLKFNTKTKYIEGIEFSFDKDALGMIGDIASSVAGTEVSVTNATASINIKWNEAENVAVPKDVVDNATEGTSDEILSDVNALLSDFEDVEDEDEDDSDYEEDYSDIEEEAEPTENASTETVSIEGCDIVIGQTTKNEFLKASKVKVHKEYSDDASCCIGSQGMSFLNLDGDVIQGVDISAFDKLDFDICGITPSTTADDLTDLFGDSIEAMGSVYSYSADDVSIYVSFDTDGSLMNVTYYAYGM